MAIGDIFRVALVGGLNAQQIVNTFYYQQSTANTTGSPDNQEMAEAFNSSVMGPISNAASQDAQWGVIESRLFIPPGGPITGYDKAITVLGQVAEDAAPPTVAVVCRKLTAFLGRKYRGRNFFAGIPITHITSGKINSGAMSLWQDVVDAITSAITHGVSGSPNFIPQIAALDSSVIVAPVGVRHTQVTGGFLDLTLRSQRRREIGVGA